jgi:hypothetical protein
MEMQGPWMVSLALDGAIATPRLPGFSRSLGGIKLLMNAGGEKADWRC